MDIKEIVKKHLLEAQMSRETEAFLMSKWKGINPESLKKVYDWFESVKSSFPLEPEKIQGRLLSFLGWFNGSSPSREKFELKNIRDIRAYSLPQIKRLWSEFKTEPIFTGEGEEETLSVDSIFYEKLDSSAPSSYTIADYFNKPTSVNENDKKTLELLFEKSKELWFGTRHLIFEDSGFRVYNVPDQVTSVAFGWYLYYIRYTYGFKGSNWCTTTPSSNNFFQSKRGDRSFYFVIDESKFPQTKDNSNASSNDGPNFYLSALQIMANDNNSKYKLTGIHNPGEPTFDRQNLLILYPKLQPLLDTDKLRYVPWSQNDQINKGKNIDPVSRINEREGDEYEFSVRPPNEKLAYINREGAVLRTSKSWRSMTEAMKKQYSFATLNEDNMYDKFSNSELFKALSQSDRKTLDNRIEIILPKRGGIKLIIKNIMQNDFYVDERLSLDKDYISLYKSRTSNKFGIYNLKEDNWVTHNGVMFDDEYKQISERAYKTKDGKRFFVVIYSKTSQPDNTSFYVLLPISGNKIDGYFVSAEKWNELKVQLVGETDPEKTNTEFDPEVDNDIKENKQTEKFITCEGCKKKFTQTIYNGKKSKPVCPHCGKVNKDN